MKLYAIQVRRYTPPNDALRNDGKFELVGVIHRKPWAEQIGNFNPMFVRYQGKRHLLHSDAGDLSDPFRRTEDYAKTFFITVSPKPTLAEYIGSIRTSLADIERRLQMWEGLESSDEIRSLAETADRLAGKLSDFVIGIETEK